MTYYDTIEEDLKRAREILAKGKPAHDEVAYLQEPMRAAALSGGAIYGADTYAAYKLLESFVAEIVQLQIDLTNATRLNDKLSDILRRTANALHGGPLENGWWSWHDLPELAEATLKSEDAAGEGWREASLLLKRLAQDSGEQVAMIIKLTAEVKRLRAEANGAKGDDDDAA